jgi:hypothetical protein
MEVPGLLNKRIIISLVYLNSNFRENRSILFLYSNVTFFYYTELLNVLLPFSSLILCKMRKQHVKFVYSEAATAFQYAYTECSSNQNGEPNAQ